MKRSDPRTASPARGSPVPFSGVPRWLPWLALAALAIAPYLASLQNPLMGDDRTLLDNSWLRTQASVASVFSHDYWYGTRHAGSGLYRPLTILSAAWNARLAPSRAGFHLANILLHALATLLAARLLATVLRSTLGSGTMAPALESARSPGLPFAAWAGAALFAVHPLASEAVLLVVGRAEILAAALGIAAFLLLLDLEQERRVGGIRFAASLVLFLLALCSKESAASWLVIGVLWRLLSPAARDGRARMGWIRLAGLAGVFVLFLGLRGVAVGWSVPAPPWIDNPLVAAAAPARLANAILLQGRYLAKMILPWRLSLDYGFAQTTALPIFPWGLFVALALLAAWAVVLEVLRRRAPSAAFLWAFIPAAFAVTGNFAFPIGTIFAERLAYLPLLGLCGLAALGLARLPIPVWGKGIAIVTVLALATARTAVRAHDFRSLAALHEATVEASPRAVKALANLGRTRLEVQKQPREAIVPLEKAVALWPDYANALRLLSDAYATTGDAALAAEYARRADAAEARQR